MAEDGTSKVASQSPEKKQDKPAIAELKNGKVTFKQKPMLLEKLSETLQEIVRFRDMIEKQEAPLQSLPEEYLPLIAKLGHESDKTLTTLARHIQQELIPPQEDDEDIKIASVKSILPLRVVEQAIKLTLIRNNYGIEPSNGFKPPAVLCVWRWEVQQNNRHWLPKSVREKLEARLTERVQARESLRQVFEALPQAVRDAILDPKGINRVMVKDPSDKMTERPLAVKSDNDKVSTPVRSTLSQVDENFHDSPTSSAPNRSKKTKDPEKDAKEKERLEKLTAKAEKVQKAKEAQDKSRALMANFFTKHKVSAASTSRESESIPGPSRTQSDFERTFKPFVLKKGTVLAPTNWFKVHKKQKGKEVVSVDASGAIVVDSDSEFDGSGTLVAQASRTSPVDSSCKNAFEQLQSIVTSLHPPLDRTRLSRSGRKGTGPQFQTYHPHSIRDLMSKLSEAEVTGNDNEVRTLLSQLRNRDLFPAKVLIYDEDARPGYFGTWTRSSKIIGPRRPFAKDVVEFDYGYDSGEEWEAEPMGDADDVLQDDDEEADSDVVDSDMESWLVDDDEEPEAMSDHSRDLSPLMLPDLPDMAPPPPPLKRKALEVDKKAKKRKVVVPLVPFSKGPCWETQIGGCEYEPFNQYRIQLFNDTRFPVDPFTFVSTCVEDCKASLKHSALAAGASVSNPNGSLAVPNLSNNINACSSTISFSSNAATTVMGKPAAALKNPFPDDHLPFLLGKISELQMASFVVLVETIYQELKAHKVKKVAIEAKIREVGEKCKEKKIWVVKPALKAQFMQS